MKSENQVKNAVQRRKTTDGTVVSNKMQKTIVVKISQRVKHPLYLKYVNRVSKYQAHDENNEAKVGDLVRLVQSRPLSRHKRWALQSILRPATVVAEINA